MKKIVIVIIFLLFGCKSYYLLTSDDINAQRFPNPNLLPALQMNINFNVPDYGVIKVTGDAEATQYSTTIAFDTVNIIKKEINENITSPYGDKKGVINVNINFVGWGYKKEEKSKIREVIDYVLDPIKHISMVFTLGLSCPILIREYAIVRKVRQIGINVEILDSKNNLIKKYEELVSNYEIIDCMCCPNEQLSVDPYRKLNAANVKQAMENIRNKIKTDFSYINNKLKK